MFRHFVIFESGIALSRAMKYPPIAKAFIEAPSGEEAERIAHQFNGGVL